MALPVLKTHRKRGAPVRPSAQARLLPRERSIRQGGRGAVRRRLRAGAPALLRGLLLAALAAGVVRLWLHRGLEQGTVCRAISPVTWEENVPSPWEAVLPELQTGDVLVTMSVHTLGWRHGHCALVVDGEGRMLLEATAIGSPSRIQPAWTWERYDTIWLLRPAALTEEEREELAGYAEELNEMPYSLFSRKAEAPGSAQCASLVWYAYHHLGYDVDGNGGWLVVPGDLLKCRLFEVTRLR